ncbi:cholesterol esterase [Streptomyces piniterrae]|uniref:Cholesterol esterase n=2 Tax=Streptomyces piniterrae TaxID=2571125 RepID=A0A4U0NSB5_9ACTN|nr:cholesterol esterase [Streptomyces piniterrae]
MLVPGVACVGAVVIALAQGAMAASFAVSGKNFKVSADEITGRGVSGFPSSLGSKDGKGHAVLLAGIESGTAKGVCLSMKQRLPLVGEVSLIVRSGSHRPISGEHLVVNADALTSGGGRVTGVQAGRDASTLDATPGVSGPQGLFGVQARTALARDVRSTAWASNGGSLTLDKVEIELSHAGKECY